MSYTPDPLYMFDMLARSWRILNESAGVDFSPVAAYDFGMAMVQGRVFVYGGRRAVGAMPHRPLRRDHCPRGASLVCVAARSVRQSRLGASEAHRWQRCLCRHYERHVHVQSQQSPVDATVPACRHADVLRRREKSGARESARARPSSVVLGHGRTPRRCRDTCAGCTRRRTVVRRAAARLTRRGTRCASRAQMHIHDQNVLDRAIEVQGDVPGARAGHAMVSSGRMLYVFGGATDMRTQTVKYGEHSQGIPPSGLPPPPPCRRSGMLLPGGCL